MAIGGEAVNHRHMRMRRQFAQRLMRAGAQHGNIGKTRNDLRRIGNRFAAPQLHIALVQNYRLPAQLAHAHIERQPCAG